MQVFTKRGDRDFDVFQDAVGFFLIIKRFFFCSRNRVQAHVIHTSQTQRFLGLQKIFTSLGKQHHLHKFSSLPRIEKISAQSCIAHLKQFSHLVVCRVGHRATWNINKWISLSKCGLCNRFS